MENERGDPQLNLMIQHWPDITMDEADVVLGRLSEPLHARRIIARSGRPMAAGCLIDTGAGDMFIKRYARSVRTEDTILPYHRFVAHLASHGIPTPTFHWFTAGSETGNGNEAGFGMETVLLWNDCVYEVSAKAWGEDRYAKAYIWDPPETNREAYRLGSFLGYLDIASRGFDEPRPAPCGYQARFSIFEHEDVLAAADGWLRERPLTARWMRETGRDFLSDLAQFADTGVRLAPRYRDIERIWTHGDTHLSNFMWQGDAPSAVFDFGMADFNTAVFELAMALERHTIQWLDVMNGDADSYRLDLARAIISGYHAVRPLTDVEKEILPDVLAVSQIEGGVTLIDYWLRSHGRGQDISWGYDVDFLAHGRWYRSPSGVAYLNGLRRILDHL